MNRRHVRSPRRAAAFRGGPPRAGVSLMEVLISIFVISIGLLGIAALIPVANYALVETTKADRSAACGQAAIREIRARRLVDIEVWPPPFTLRVALMRGNTYAIDPLGSVVFYGGTTGVRNVNNLSPVAPLFTWRDDLTFELPDGRSRPVAVTYDGQHYQGDYSWMFTVNPSPLEDYNQQHNPLGWQQRRTFAVSVAVFYRRDFGLDTGGINAVTRSAEMLSAGVVRLSGDPIEIEPGQWILLVGQRRNHMWAPSGWDATLGEWYRVVGGWGQYVSLEGPTWTGNSNGISAVFVPDVMGVYTTTVELDRSPEWWPQ